jgi:hypothetical protein
MFLQWLFFLYAINAKIIKNVNLPSCVNCKYYRPLHSNFFHSNYNECNYFGTKNIQTDLIDYDIVKYCREDESRCGLEAKYFEENKYVALNMILHSVIHPTNIFLIVFLSLYVCAYVYLSEK